MRVWLIKLGEPLPLTPTARLFRCGLLAQTLARRGHEVTWWSSTFDHFTRKFHFAQDATVRIADSYKLELVDGGGYSKPVGLERMRHHRRTARRLASRFADAERPDLIVSSFPVVETGIVALRYSQEQRIPLVVDVRDHWPDIFLKVVPGPLRPLGRLALWQQFRDNRVLFSGATSLTAISLKQLDWALRQACRERSDDDAVFYHGYPRVQLSAQEVNEAEKFWSDRNVHDHTFTCCYFGAVGRQFDFRSILAAARTFEAEGKRDVRFVICGEGGALESYRRQTSNFPDSVMLCGWVDLAKIIVLMRRSKIGLAPYVAEDSYALPNKPFEYFYGGLPVVSSIRGELEELLERNVCGLTYEALDDEALTRSIRTLHDDAELRSRMAENARALYERSCVAELIYENMASHFERVAGCLPDTPSARQPAVAQHQ